MIVEVKFQQEKLCALVLIRIFQSILIYVRYNYIHTYKYIYYNPFINDKIFQELHSNMIVASCTDKCRIYFLK